jgi:hypothetical protein
MNEGETLLTERQWRGRQCDSFGHQITILEADGEPVQIICDNCGRSWQVVRQPLGTAQTGQPQP